jgi:D-amino-acid dehydrogenase
VIGPTPIPKLWLATGHGTLGWTMAAGTGRLLADWMSGEQPQIDTEGLTIDRYGPTGSQVRFVDSVASA